jgi:hypothetical protein
VIGWRLGLIGWGLHRGHGLAAPEVVGAWRLLLGSALPARPAAVALLEQTLEVRPPDPDPPADPERGKRTLIDP